MTGELLTATELMARLGLKKSAFYRREQAGQFKHLEVTRPIGARRYSTVLVDRFLAGESTVQLGGRRLSRAS